MKLICISGIIRNCYVATIYDSLKSSKYQHALGVNKIFHTQHNLRKQIDLKACLHAEMGFIELAHIHELKVQPCAGSKPKIIT